MPCLLLSPAQPCPGAVAAATLATAAGALMNSSARLYHAALCCAAPQSKAVACDAHLGGASFDARLASSLAREFQQVHGVDIGSNWRALRRLRSAAEQAKRQLSSAHSAAVAIDALHGGIDFCTTITRTHFESQCADLFDHCMDCVIRVSGDVSPCGGSCQ